MSYILVKDLGGKDRGLKFNNGALDVYMQRINVNEVGASAIYACFYAGLIGNDIAKGVHESDFNYENIVDWVDEMFDNGRADEIKLVCDTMAETNAYKKRLEAVQANIRALSNEEEDKKKQEAA